eukprot:1356188-Pyramimonas_sp.AAC.1
MGKKRGQQKEPKPKEAHEKEPEATGEAETTSVGRRLLSLTRSLQTTSVTFERCETCASRRHPMWRSENSAIVKCRSLPMCLSRYLLIIRR